MPLTIPEILSDLPQAIGLVQAVEAAIAAMPPAATRKAVDYATAIGCQQASVGYMVATLIDTIEAQAKS